MIIDFLDSGIQIKQTGTILPPKQTFLTDPFRIFHSQKIIVLSLWAAVM